MTWLDFTIAALVVYRLSLLISEEDGPAWIFRKLRNVPPKKSSAHAGIRCIWCVGIYASALVATFLWKRGYVPGNEWAFYWLGLAGASVVLNQTFTKGGK